MQCANLRSDVHLGAAIRPWVQDLGDARDAFFQSISIGAGGTLGAGDAKFATADPKKLLGCRLKDNGTALFALISTAINAQQSLGGATATATMKDSGEFTFGSQKDFDGGLQLMIGSPTGLNEHQWIANMEKEHCDVSPEQYNSKEWGASDRNWTTGNYSLTTTPRSESERFNVLAYFLSIDTVTVLCFSLLGVNTPPQRSGSGPGCKNTRLPAKNSRSSGAWARMAGRTSRIGAKLFRSSRYTAPRILESTRCCKRWLKTVEKSSC